MIYYVYILISDKDRKFYVGQTNNIDRRISEHNSGKVLATKGRRPFRLIKYEQFESREDALKREKFYKTQRGRQMLAQLKSNTEPDIN